MLKANSVQEPRRRTRGTGRGPRNLVTVSFNMPAELRSVIDELARRERRSLSQQVLALIDRGLESQAAEAPRHA